MAESAYDIIEKALKGKIFRFRDNTDFYKFNSLDRTNPDLIYVTNLSKDKSEIIVSMQLRDFFEIDTSELEQLAKSLDLNETTLRAIMELESGEGKRFDSVEALLKDLNDDSENNSTKP